MSGFIGICEFISQQALNEFLNGIYGVNSIHELTSKLVRYELKELYGVSSIHSNSPYKQIFVSVVAVTIKLGHSNSAV